MSLIRKIYKIANIKANEILARKHKSDNHNPSLMSNEEFMQKYNNSNNQIKRLRNSIQNTKL